MAKTDKELTAEIVNNFVASWNNSGKTNPINSPQLIDLIKNVHETIQNLPETKND